MILRFAAPSLASLSVIRTRGARHRRFSSLRCRRLAAPLSRRLWTSTSSTMPSWSTARQKPVFLAGDLHRNLVQMPLVSGTGQPPPDPIGECLTELHRPSPHDLVDDDNAACGQHLLDHAQAERKAEIQSNRMADDLGREAIAGVAGGSRRRNPVRLRDLTRHRKPPT
jgi:hypothetical protein